MVSPIPSGKQCIYSLTQVNKVPISNDPIAQWPGHTGERYFVLWELPADWFRGHVAGLPSSVSHLVVVQSLSCIRLSVTPWTAARQASLSFTISQSLLKLIESVMPSNHLILCCPLLLPSICPNIKVFSTESVLHIRWPKCWSFSFSPSSEYSVLISFRIDWLDLQAVPETLASSSTPQFKSINSSALRFLYGPTLTSIHDYWKSHSFD